MSIKQKLLKAISIAQPKLVTLGVGLAITLAIGTVIEQIYLVLISVFQDDGITRKYEARARWLIRRFSTWFPPPVFIIYRRDFPKEIWKEKACYDVKLLLQSEFQFQVY